MLYPVYVHVGDADHAHRVTFPDFAGCFTAADEWSELPTAIQEAVQAHFHGEPEAVPPPTPLEVLTVGPQYQDGVWLLADVDLSRIDTRSLRLNVSPPSNLVQQIDTWASAHHMTRSGLFYQGSASRHA